MYDARGGVETLWRKSSCPLVDDWQTVANPNQASNQGNGKRAMAVDIPVIREAVQRVCTRTDVLDACKRRDLGAVITVLSAHGITQGQLSVLTGIPQGRLSEYKTHKRRPTATSTFETFADGLGMPPAARRALGLDPEAAGSGPLHPAGGRPPAMPGASPGDISPLLTNL
jgi:hypothetical protein